MEAIFLDCGAGGPQLKRNPLGCHTKDMAFMRPLTLISLLAIPLACSGDSTAPPPPPPPNGLTAGRAAWTHEKDGQPATRISDSGDARFEPGCPSYFYLGNDPFVQFILGAGTNVEKRTYSLDNVADPANHVAAVYSTHIYAFTTPPVPTTGQLNILYVSSTRVDGTFEFRGGADSAGVVFTILVQGAFSATPFPPPPACP